MKRSSGRRKTWTFPEARDAVLVWLSQQTGTVTQPSIIAGSQAPAKLVKEALAELRKAGLVNCWPAYKAWAVTDKGRDEAAKIDMQRQQAALAPWQWNKRGAPTS